MSARTSTPTPIPLFYRTLTTSMGPMVAMAEERGLVLLEFEDRPALPPEVDQLRHQYHYQPVPGDHPHLDHIERELRAYFAGELRRFQVPLEAPGTPFERAVWSGLLTIPYGETRSYGQMAAQLGRPGASRAVGLANGRNRIAIVIPCHRVIGADGSLVGYGGGKHRKERLLRLESSVAGAVGGGAGQLALGFDAQAG